MANRASNKLIRAVRGGDVAKVKALIASHKHSHFEKWSNGYELLCIAFFRWHRTIAKLLLKSGFPVNRKRKTSKNTPLHFAVKKKDIEIVTMLLDRDADVNAKNRLGRTPLHWAATDKNLTIARLLLNKNADINVPDNEGQSPIRYAIDSDNKKMIDLLFRHSSCGVIRSEDETEEFILKAFLDVHIDEQSMNNRDIPVFRSDAKGYTPLHRAVIWNNKRTVKLLLRKGADVNATCENNVTPLYLAVQLEHDQIVEVLSKHEGIDLDAGVSPLDITSETPLFRAVICKNEPIVRMLLKAGARVGDKNQYGETALDIAIGNNDEAVMATLLDFGAADGYERFEGSSPLHIAAIHYFEKTTDKLLEDFVDVEYKNNYGQTALHVASLYGNGHIVQELLNFGANVNSTCNEGLIPLHYTIPIVYEQYNDEKPENSFYKSMITSSLSREERDYDYTVYMIQTHTLKLMALNRYVSKENLDLLIIDYELEKFQTDCEQEVELMKSVKIGKTNISYYDLMAKSIDQLAILCRNKSVANALKSFNCKEKFVNYYKMIYYHLKKGQNRRDLVTLSLKSFNILSGFALPETILLDIFIGLSNEDLKNLINAGTEKDRV